jgi:hypothetical protein
MSLLYVATAAQAAGERYRLSPDEIAALRAHPTKLLTSVRVRDGLYRVLAAIGDGKSIRHENKNPIARLRLFVNFFDFSSIGEAIDDRHFLVEGCALHGGLCPGWLLIDLQTGDVAVALRWMYDDAGNFRDKTSSLDIYRMACSSPTLRETLVAFATEANKADKTGYPSAETRYFDTPCRSRGK